MRFGLFSLLQRAPDWSEEAVYEYELAQMAQAESCGFESVWIAEHHFGEYGLCPVPPVLAAFLAGRSSRLRLGMGVSLLPLHDPVALAEQLAVLDQLSGGRLDVGIGRGGPDDAYEGFGATYEESRERVEEGLELLRRCWSGEPLHFEGRFRRISGVRVTPRPRQRPHPPLYFAANSPESNVAAARLGLPTLSSFSVPAEELRRRRAVFVEEAVGAGHDAETATRLNAESWGMRCVFVALDRATAIATAQEPFMAYQRRLGERPNAIQRLEFFRLRPFEQYLEQGLALFGSPDEVVDALGRYGEVTGYRRVLLMMSLAGLPLVETLRSLELFAARVLPQLADAAPALSRRP